MTAIEALPEPDYVHLRRWFSERDWQKWDDQVQEDAAVGRLDFLVREALEGKADGTLEEL